MVSSCGGCIFWGIFLFLFLGGFFEGFCFALLFRIRIFWVGWLVYFCFNNLTTTVFVSFLQILTNCGAVFKYYIHVPVSVLNPEVKHSRLSFHYLSRWHYMAKH